MIPYAQHCIDDADIDAVAQVLRSNCLTGGPTIVEFEAEIARCAGMRHAIAVNSGTAALHAAMHQVACTSIGTGVITTPFTFLATANAIRYAGLLPIFTDVEPDTLCIDPYAVERLCSLGHHTAVLAVDFAGHPADWQRLREICTQAKRSELTPCMQFVVDSAHSFGATLNSRSVGAYTDFATFSFHPVKTITTGEGGAVCTDDAGVAVKLRAFRDHGRVDGQACGTGYNYRMPAINAALGLSQAGKLGRFLARRRGIAAAYDIAFRDLPLQLPIEQPSARSAWHLYVVRVDTARRDAFRHALAEREIGTQIHYPLVWEQPQFESWAKLGRELCPVAVRESARIVSLPLFPGMTDNEVDQVIDAVVRVAKETL